jgi:pimeloyl-[acyl-carrier protein] methyl ester esterase
MTSTLAPACPHTDSPDATCAKRLILSECLDHWRREAQHGEVDTGRYRCRYVVWGRGPTLVLVPGMASDAISFVMLMDRLKSHFRCVSYELPEGGPDGARLMSYHHEDLTRDLFALLDRLRIAECFLLGFSFGSTIALSALHQQPQRFTRGILQGGFARRPLAPAEVLVASFARFLPGTLGQLPLRRRVIEHNHREPFLQRDPDVWEFFMEHTCRIPMRAIASRVLMIHRLDLRSILPTIPQPMLMICGDRDPLVGKTCEQELRQGLPSVARAEIEHCGHQPHQTHPEVMAEVVRQFLQAPG